MHWLSEISSTAAKAVIACTTMLLGACSIHPLPQDVTALDFDKIGKKVVCEAQDALKYQVERLLSEDRSAPQDLKILWIKNLYEDIDQFPKLKFERRFERRTLALIEKYSKFLMYFDFTFTIYEQNDNSAEVNMISRVVAGSTGLNLKASNNRKRQNITNYRSRYTFQEVVATSECRISSTLPDPMYPITGDIGIDKVVDQFLKRNEYGYLFTNQSKDKVSLWATALQFTTVVSGTVSPKVTMSPIGKNFQVADAGIAATSTRSDVHEVVIGFSLPTEDPKDPAYLISRAVIPGVNIEREELAIRGRSLDNYLNEQIRRNLIYELNAPRTAVFGLF